MITDQSNNSTAFAWLFEHARDNVGLPLWASDFDTFADAIRAGLATTIPDPPDWGEKAINEAKRALPGFGPYLLRGSRCNESVAYFTSLVWDIDRATQDETSALFDRLRLLGVRGFAYESPSSGLKGDTPRYRLVLAVDRPVMPHEWAPLKASAASVLGIPFDPGAEKLSQIAFVGRFAGTHERQWIDFAGMPIEVGAELAAAPVAQFSAPEPAQEFGEEISVADLKKLSKRLQSCAATTKAPTLGRMIDKALRGERYALDGTRHVWNVRLGYVLGAEFKYGDPVQIAEHFAVALAAQGGKTVADFAELIRSGQRRGIAVAAKDAADCEEIRRALDEAAHRRRRRCKLGLVSNGVAR